MATPVTTITSAATIRVARVIIHSALPNPGPSGERTADRAVRSAPATAGHPTGTGVEALSTHVEAVGASNELDELEPPPRGLSGRKGARRTTTRRAPKGVTTRKSQRPGERTTTSLKCPVADPELPQEERRSAVLAGRDPGIGRGHGRGPAPRR